MDEYLGLAPSELRTYVQMTASSRRYCLED